MKYDIPIEITPNPNDPESMKNATGFVKLVVTVDADSPAQALDRARAVMRNLDMRS